MLRGHFERTHGGDLAVIFNSKHYVFKPIELDQFLWWYLDLFLLTDIAIELLLVSLLIISGLLSWWLSLSLFALDLLELSLGLSSEETLVPINEFLVLVVQIWHLLEQEIGAQGPVELFHWELKAVLVSYRHRHVVVVFNA